MRGNWKRIVVGLLSVFLIGNVTALFLPVFEVSEAGIRADIESYIFWLSVVAGAWAFLEYSIGGFIAQKNFLLPALLFAACEFIYGFWSSQMHAPSSQKADLQFVFSQGVGEFFQIVVWPVLPLIVIPLAAAAAGSLVGMRLSRLTKSGQVAI